MAARRSAERVAGETATNSDMSQAHAPAPDTNRTTSGLSGAGRETRDNAGRTQGGPDRPDQAVADRAVADRAVANQARSNPPLQQQGQLDEALANQGQSDLLRADQIRSGRSRAARTRAAGRMTARQSTQVLRDFQRGKVYEAEHLVQRIFDRSAEYPMVEVAGSHLALPVERRFGSIDAVQQYVSQVLALRWVRNTWRRAATAVTVRERAGGAQAHYLRPGAIMAVPGRRANSTWALRELVILHEISHHLADTIEIAHGAAFVDRLLTLVDGVVGPEAALLLRVTMVDSGVRVS